MSRRTERDKLVSDVDELFCCFRREERGEAESWKMMQNPRR